MNKLGWCMGIDKAAFLKEVGFDYIECTVTALKLEDGAASRIMIEKYRNSPLPVKAVNVFFPGEISVIGPSIDQERIQRYVASVAKALQDIGTEIAVLGSGRARMIPEGWEAARAEEQMVQLLHTIANAFKGSGVTLAIEPLNTKESNLINSVADGVHYARLVNQPEIRVLADFYHMDEENEPLDTLLEHKDWLAHIHLADTGRMAPGTGQYPYETFVSHLKAIGYKGMISAECKLNNEAQEVAASLAFMKKHWNQ